MIAIKFNRLSKLASTVSFKRKHEMKKFKLPCSLLEQGSFRGESAVLIDEKSAGYSKKDKESFIARQEAEKKERDLYLKNAQSFATDVIATD